MKKRIARLLLYFLKDQIEIEWGKDFKGQSPWVIFRIGDKLLKIKAIYKRKEDRWEWEEMGGR